MDGYSSKRVHVGIVSRKGPGVVLRDNMKHRDQSNKCSNRPGCNGRICSSSGAQVGCSSKFSSKRPFHSSSGKEGFGSSSGIQNLRKSFPDPFGKLSSKLETDSSENDSIQDDLEELEFISPHGLFHTGLHAKSESPVVANAMLMERGSCSTDSSNISKRVSIQSYEVDNEDPHASMRPRSLCQKSNGSSSRYNSRNLTCVLDHPSYASIVGEKTGKRKRTRSWLCNQLQVGTTRKWSADARSPWQGSEGANINRDEKEGRGQRILVIRILLLFLER